MFDAMSWLVKDAKTHDSLFFHCPFFIYLFIYYYSNCFLVDSGHGGQVKDETGTETDGMDEGTAFASSNPFPPLKMTFFFFFSLSLCYFSYISS